MERLTSYAYETENRLAHQCGVEEQVRGMCRCAVEAALLSALDLCEIECSGSYSAYRDEAL